MERRSTFRFRLPWSQPAPEPEPASKPSTPPNTKTGPNRTTTRQATRSRTASKPSSSTSPKTSPSSSPTTESSTGKQPPSATTTAKSRKPSSPAQPPAGTQGTLAKTPEIAPQPSAESKAPIQSTTDTSPLPESSPVPPQPSAESKGPIQSTTTNTSPSPKTNPVPPEPSDESKSLIQSSTTNTKPTNAPASPKSETQTPTTTITTTPTSTVSQNPPSRPPGVAPSKIESQDQQGITSQPASPSDVATKSNASQPPSPSPSRPAPQSRETSTKTSPTRKDPQVLSTDQLTPKAVRPASQTSSNLPFGITSQGQLKDQTIAQPTSPPKQSQESSQTSSKSTGKEPTPATVWPQSEQMELLKKEAISDTFAEAKDRSPEKVIQPSELSEVRSTRGITEGPSQISDSSRIISEPKTDRLLETNTPETKEVKEVAEETRDKNIGGFLTTKEKPDILFQSKQANTDNDQIRVNRVSNGKQTRSISSQLKNKRVASGSKETAGSPEQDIPLNKEVKDYISKFIHKMAVGDGKQNLGETPVSVITLAGDNRGASMQLGSDSSRKGRAVHIHRGYKLNPDESANATTNAEGRQPNDARTMKDQEIEAYLNCNVQGLNNSITFDSSIEGKNPGIHMLFPHMSSKPTKSSEGTGVFEAHKAEFNVTPAQKHTYEPPIRRCLEGLLEPSDSDSDNPEKPWRHGRHVGSMEKRDNEIDIL